ncbi:hypothetical protein [Nocardioides limicola]|uniref:hypothetical protein n=1 Tax=Nocardioides limicola TaxID=2803368 RepID=UPI00193C395D|nr:hypothetical protein [Nocardioides sp. DJM-14]
MPFLHLHDGSTVIPDHDSLLLVAPDERFAAVTGDLDALTPVLLGSAPVPATGIAAEVTAAVLDWQVGELADQPRTPCPTWHLTDLLRPQTVAAALRPLGMPVSVHVADLLDDTVLTDRDAAGQAQGAWLPVHRELGALVLGPVLGDGLSWADVRFRRLAASPTRPQLQALWENWSRHGDTHDLRPSRADAQDAVRRLLEWLPGNAAHLRRHQVVVPMRPGGDLTTHPVLPVPRGLMERVPA